MNMKFDIQESVMNAYNLYEIGDVFHNDNGNDYIILGLSEEREKALLCTKTKPTLYIGAKCLDIHSWGFGHYFMENLEEALEWFAVDDSVEEEKKEPFAVNFSYFDKCDDEIEDIVFFMAKDVDEVLIAFREWFNINFEECTCLSRLITPIEYLDTDKFV